MKGFKNRIGIVHLLDPQDLGSTDKASAWLDTKAFNGATLCAIVGAITGASGNAYVTPVLQEADVTTAASATAVAAGDMIGSFSAVNTTALDQVTQAVDYIGSSRYVRVNFDFTGTPSASLIACVGILSRPVVLPAVAPAAVTAT